MNTSEIPNFWSEVLLVCVCQWWIQPNRIDFAPVTVPACVGWLPVFCGVALASAVPVCEVTSCSVGWERANARSFYLQDGVMIHNFSILLWQVLQRKALIACAAFHHPTHNGGPMKLSWMAVLKSKLSICRFQSHSRSNRSHEDPSRWLLAPSLRWPRHLHGFRPNSIGRCWCRRTWSVHFIFFRQRLFRETWSASRARTSCWFLCFCWLNPLYNLETRKDYAETLHIFAACFVLHCVSQIVCLLPGPGREIATELHPDENGFDWLVWWQHWRWRGKGLVFGKVVSWGEKECNSSFKGRIKWRKWWEA